ncbi:MAG: glycosyltransferase [Myxococcota bacterium]
MTTPNPFAINSREYWDHRFSNDWDAHSGPMQARFFAELAVNHFPAWLTELVKQHGWSVCDWGCAEGAGTAVLAQAFPGLKVHGIDFSAAAIAVGRTRYPGVSLQAADLLSGAEERFDVVFSSNTLEHFREPWSVVRRLTQVAQHALVFLLPWEERELFTEHFVSFDERNVPLVLDGGFVLTHRAVFDTSTLVPTYWFGKQALLIYLRPSDATRPALVLGSLGTTGELERLTQSLGQSGGSPHALGADELHARVRELNQRVLNQRTDLARAQKRIAELDEYTFDKECYIAHLSKRLDEANSELERLNASSLVSASRQVDHVRDRVKGAINRVQTKVQRDGVKGLASAVTRRLFRAASEAEQPSAAAPREWPQASIRLVKPIDVKVIKQKYSFGEQRAAFAVVTTVKNEEARLSSFLEDIESQTLLPSRLVIVDGGSSDNTVSRLREFEERHPDWVTVIADHPCNIARGRNRGVQVTTEPVIVFVDAGCRLSPDLFANLYGPLNDQRADLVGGIYHPSVPTEHARHFIPAWQTFTHWEEFLPSARALAVRRPLFDACGGFPEYLTLTGEDTLFDINYRRVSRRWVFNLEATVVWEAPTDAERAMRLATSYSRGDGESGVGDFTFRPGEQAHADNPIRGHQLSGYLQGLAQRARIEAERRKVKGVVVILSGVSFTDIGGGQRATQLALELIRRGYKVVFVNLYPRYGDQVQRVFFDVDLTLLELYFMTDFDAAQLAQRYADTGLPFTIVTEFPHPRFVPAIETLKQRIPRARYVYDYIDLWNSSLGGDWYSADVELQLIARADLLVASARTLKEALEQKSQKPVHLLANAVNGHLFRSDVPLPRPEDLPVDRPYVVYVGSLYGEWFDWDTIEVSALELPDIDFVFIGDAAGVPRAARMKERRPNALFLGPRPQSDLPAYLQHADACLIPFRTDSEITKFVNPLKVYEYLAMGRPVVATNMQELAGMPGVHIPSPGSSFAQAIELARQEPFDAAAVSAFVRGNTWSARIAALEALLVDPEAS